MMWGQKIVAGGCSWQRMKIGLSACDEYGDASWAPGLRASCSDGVPVKTKHSIPPYQRARKQLHPSRPGRRDKTIAFRWQWVMLARATTLGVAPGLGNHTRSCSSYWHAHYPQVVGHASKNCNPWCGSRFRATIPGVEALTDMPHYP